MGRFAPGILIDSPPRPRQRPNHLGTAIDFLPTDRKLENGFTYKGYACGWPESHEIQCEWDDRTEKPQTGAEDGTLVNADPFVVVSRFDCGVNGYSYEEAVDRATQQLEQGEWHAVEHAVMAGTAGINPSFQGATDLTGAEASSMLGGISSLITNLAFTYGGVGTIHIPVGLAPYFCEAGICEGEPGNLTLCGTGERVVFGAGYAANVGPDGNPPPEGEAWIYGTGQIVGYRSEVIVNPDERQSIDRSMNNRIVVAERVYVLGWDCDTYAVRVRISCCC